MPLASTSKSSFHSPEVRLGEARFDDDYYRASFYAPRSSEFHFASDITPAARVSNAFAQFTPGEAKPKRYSSLATVIR